MPHIVPPLVAEMVAEVSESAGSDVSPFWLCDSEGIPEEGMYRLAMELDVENADYLLDRLPFGYRIVHSVFLWEQSRAGEGFGTGTVNSGENWVLAAAVGYERVGMFEEAAGLRAMLEQYAKTPNDYELVEGAYNSVPNPYKDDWDRIPHLVRLLCKDAYGYFCVEA
ncbi:hypothetical protein [Cupriavidus sp. RAF12]|uniref:hypothetical protein n=1 Tax=Cupriavidus sp. RAF12 TaxID=3233050 RepID=UPI003F8F0291